MRRLLEHRPQFLIDDVLGRLFGGHQIKNVAGKLFDGPGQAVGEADGLAGLVNPAIPELEDPGVTERGQNFSGVRGMLTSPWAWVGSIGDHSVAFGKIKGADPFRGNDEALELAGDGDDRATIRGDGATRQTSAYSRRHTGIQPEHRGGDRQLSGCLGHASPCERELPPASLDKKEHGQRQGWSGFFVSGWTLHDDFTGDEY